MQKYFLKEINRIITGNDYHHIKNVMRMKTGDFIIVSSESVSYKAKITAITDYVEYEIVEKLEPPNEPNITLIQGLPKGSKTDFILKYATCFGVTRVILVEMERSVAKLANVDAKLKRYESIVKEASELAHRSSIPKVEMTKGISSIDLSAFDVVLLADEEEKINRIKSFEVDISNKNIAVIVGPEGGIDEKLRKFLKDRAISVSLGSNILPTESAVLYMLSALNEK